MTTQLLALFMLFDFLYNLFFYIGLNIEVYKLTWSYKIRLIKYTGKCNLKISSPNDQ